MLLLIEHVLANAKLISCQGIPNEKPLPRLPFSDFFDFES